VPSPVLAATALHLFYPGQPQKLPSTLQLSAVHCVVGIKGTSPQGESSCSAWEGGQNFTGTVRKHPPISSCPDGTTSILSTSFQNMSVVSTFLWQVKSYF